MNRPRGPLTWLDPGAFGTLGVGGGFALGAKLARPDSEVITLVPLKAIFLKVKEKTMTFTCLISFFTGSGVDCMGRRFLRL